VTGYAEKTALGDVGEERIIKKPFIDNVNKGQFRDIERHFRLFESWRRAASAMMSLLSKSPA